MSAGRGGAAEKSLQGDDGEIKPVSNPINPINPKGQRCLRLRERLCRGWSGKFHHLTGPGASKGRRQRENPQGFKKGEVKN